MKTHLYSQSQIKKIRLWAEKPLGTRGIKRFAYEINANPNSLRIVINNLRNKIEPKYWKDLV